jgi:hypothetical protein
MKRSRHDVCLYREKYLAPEYNVEAKQLHEKYHAIEVDPKIPKEKRKKP